MKNIKKFAKFNHLNESSGSGQPYNGHPEIKFNNPKIKLDKFIIDNNYYNLVNTTQRAKVLVNYSGTILPFYLTTGLGGKNLPAGWYPFFGVGSDGWMNKTNGGDMVNFYKDYCGDQVANIFRDIATQLNNFYGTDPDKYPLDGDPTIINRNSGKPSLSDMADKVESFINKKLKEQGVIPCANDGKAKGGIIKNIELLASRITGSTPAGSTTSMPIPTQTSTMARPGGRYGTGQRNTSGSTTDYLASHAEGIKRVLQGRKEGDYKKFFKGIDSKIIDPFINQLKTFVGIKTEGPAADEYIRELAINLNHRIQENKI